MLTTGTKREHYPEPPQRATASCQLIHSPDRDRLEVATDQAIAACSGDARDAVKALIVANDFLEAQVEQAKGRRVERIYARLLPRSIQNLYRLTKH
jgi:hypothetical protein